MNAISGGEEGSKVDEGVGMEISSCRPDSPLDAVKSGTEVIIGTWKRAAPAGSELLFDLRQWKEADHRGTVLDHLAKFSS